MDEGGIFRNIHHINNIQKRCETTNGCQPRCAKRCGNSIKNKCANNRKYRWNAKSYQEWSCNGCWCSGTSYPFQKTAETKRNNDKLFPLIQCQVRNDLFDLVHGTRVDQHIQNQKG